MIKAPQLSVLCLPDKTESRQFDSTPFPHHRRMKASFAAMAMAAMAMAAMATAAIAMAKVRPLLLILVLLLGTKVVHAQQNQQVRVIDVVWGFDGRVVTGQFIPLSILIDNLSDQPIEASARLRRVTGMVNEVGGRSMQPVFVGPNSRRWIQFYPYIADRMATWYLDLQTEERTFTFDAMDQPRSVFDREKVEGEAQQSLPAVILDPQGVSTRSPTTIKHMPAEIFPPYATATNGLYALFLDHVPDWETPRQEAMLSWLKSGGRLHLLLDSNHQSLKFSGMLAPLNDPFPEFSVGSGTVTRHDVQRDGLTIQIVTPVVTPMALQQPDSLDNANFNQSAVNLQSSESVTTVNDDEIFSWLRDLTQPDHSWLLIFLLSLCYVALIFPGCWILSKQRTLHFLVTYGAIAGLAVVFSMIFLIIGRRGYGESTSLHSLCVARAEDDTHWSALQYNMLFVTNGDRYTIQEKDTQTLMASGASDERVDALITSGNTASFVSQIPPFSSQSMICRRRLTVDSWDLSVKEIVQSGEELTTLLMTFNDKFPVGNDVRYFVLHGRSIHTASVNGTTLTLANITEKLTHFLNPPDQGVYGNAFSPVRALPASNNQTLEDSVAECFRKSLSKLVARSMADDFVSSTSAFTLPEGKFRLLVYAPIPKFMELTVDADVRRDGRVLFVRDLPMQADSGTEPKE